MMQHTDMGTDMQTAGGTQQDATSRQPNMQPKLIPNSLLQPACMESIRERRDLGLSCVL